jgi:hypothetical protein
MMQGRVSGIISGWKYPWQGYIGADIDPVRSAKVSVTTACRNLTTILEPEVIERRTQCGTQEEVEVEVCILGALALGRLLC